MTADTVLLVTASYDEAPRYVGAALERIGIPFFRLDTDRFPSEIKASFDPQGDITISDGERSISGMDIKSVWYRRNVAPNLPDGLDAGHSFLLRTRGTCVLGGGPSRFANGALVEFSAGHLEFGA